MPSDNNDNDSKNSSLTPAEREVGGFSRQFAMAMELPFILVAAVGVGGLLGFFLDRWLHTKPALMLILGAFGFIGGLRDVLRRLAKP
ncbi:MAG TPA: AtpZ/AtpI family protein [Dongiaceae bacterium]|nr:AtpZ/AtpI family protein [Dongiaceae bacterium]